MADLHSPVSGCAPKKQRTSSPPTRTRAGTSAELFDAETDVLLLREWSQQEEKEDGIHDVEPSKPTAEDDLDELLLLQESWSQHDQKPVRNEDEVIALSDSEPEPSTSQQSEADGHSELEWQDDPIEDMALESEPDYDFEPDPECDYEAEFGPDSDLELEFGPDFEPNAAPKAEVRPSEAQANDQVDEPEHLEQHILPVELMQIVFGNIACSELLLTVNRVCSTWHQIIDKDTNYKYRKLFLGYRFAQPAAELQMNCFFAESVLSVTDTNLYGLVWLVGKCLMSPGISAHPQEISAFLNTLSQHNLALFQAAQAWLTTFPDHIIVPWSIYTCLCVMMLMSGDAHSMRALLFACTTPAVLKDNTHILECLYLLASLLLGAHRKLNVSPRLAYNLEHALHMYMATINNGKHQITNPVEPMQASAASQLPPAERSRLTHEQLRIVNYELQATDCVRVLAYAGTGKTSTLAAYTKARPDDRFLVLMFNRDASVAASQVFSASSVVMTLHKLAYHWRLHEHNSVTIGHYFQCRGGICGQIYYNNISKCAAPGLPSYFHFKPTWLSVTNFMNSSDKQVEFWHTPEQFTFGGELVRLKAPQRQKVVGLARHLWNCMVQRSDMPITFDGYLKYFQLLKPSLAEQYDIDEAQDLNAAMLDVLQSQKQIARMYTGDKHQQIYGWRGAVNALQLLDCSRTFYLTRSFRFGPELGLVANMWLQEKMFECKRALIGSMNRTQLQMDQSPTCERRTVILCRYNSTVFDLCYQLGLQNVHFEVKGNTMGFLKNGLTDLRDLYILSLGAAERMKRRPDIESERFKKLESLAAAVQMAEQMYDVELLRKCDLVQKYQIKIVDMCNTVVKYHCSERAQYEISTVHMSKGLQWPSVILADDYEQSAYHLQLELNVLEGEDDGQGPHVQMSMTSTTRADPAMHNVLYVAMTRAQTNLVMNRMLAEFVCKSMNDHFEQWTSASCSADQLCVVCNKPVNAQTDRAMLLTRKQVDVCPFGSVQVPAAQGRRVVVSRAQGPCCEACVLSKDTLLHVLHQVMPNDNTGVTGDHLSSYPVRPPGDTGKDDVTRRWLRCLANQVIDMDRSNCSFANSFSY